jgi:hypothetical protein
MLCKIERHGSLPMAATGMTTGRGHHRADQNRHVAVELTSGQTVFARVAKAGCPPP